VLAQFVSEAGAECARLGLHNNALAVLRRHFGADRRMRIRLVGEGGTPVRHARVERRHAVIGHVDDIGEMERRHAARARTVE
jgi:hypothetical protein